MTPSFPMIEFGEISHENEQIIVPLVDGGRLINIFRPKNIKSLNSRIILLKNKLIQKRNMDKIQQQLDSVVYKPNNVAVAVTRLNGSTTTQQTPSTPPSPIGETVVDKKRDLLTLSGMKKRVSDVAAEFQPPSVMLNSTSRLSSLKAV